LKSERFNVYYEGPLGAHRLKERREEKKILKLAFKYFTDNEEQHFPQCYNKYLAS
jgi:hypothetical protein